MKLILRFIALKMSILRVDAAIIKRKKVKRNVCPKTAVGDKYVYEYMAKNGCRIGGEQSGHIIFSKYASTGDGILTSLKMMEVMLAKKQPMSKLAEPLKIYPQVLENVRVTDKKAAQNGSAVQETVEKVADALAIPAVFLCVNLVLSRWCVSWWKLQIMILGRNMWMKLST